MIPHVTPPMSIIPLHYVCHRMILSYSNHVTFGRDRTERIASSKIDESIRYLFISEEEFLVNIAFVELCFGLFM